MKIIAGLLSLAILNIVFINLLRKFYYRELVKRTSYFSDSPTNLDIRSAAETEKKVESASLAHALARKVFPVPGGYKHFLAEKIQ